MTTARVAPELARVVQQRFSVMSPSTRRPFRLSLSRLWTIASGAAVGLGALLVAPEAEARPNVLRDGVQVEGLIGGSNCLPGRASCRPDNDTLNGSTGGAVGGGALVGWRLRPWLTLGVMYRGGMFRPDYEIEGGGAYDRGAQHSVLGVIRPTLPIWRFDLGLTLAPGYSRQIFRYEGGAQDYTQGFAFGVGPTVDIFVTQRFFLGFEADFIFNGHRNVCEVRDARTSCVQYAERHANPVHQAIYGLHFGFTTGG